MGRQFGSSIYAERTAGIPVNVFPFTMACWYLPHTVSSNRALMSLRLDVSNNYSISTNGSSLILTSRRNDAEVTALAASFLKVGRWAHCCGIFESITSRTVIGNGRTIDTDTTSQAQITPTIFHLGKAYSAGEIIGGGSIAHAAIWDVALTSTEIIQLANGLYPWEIRYSNLKAYWPLNEFGTNAEFLHNRTPYNPTSNPAYSLTLVGTSLYSADPPMNTVKKPLKYFFMTAIPAIHRGTRGLMRGIRTGI